MVDPASNSWLVYNRDSNNDGNLDPVFVCGPGDPEDFLYRGARVSLPTSPGDGARGDKRPVIDDLEEWEFLAVDGNHSII